MEFRFQEADFARIRDLFRRYVGTSLAHGKRELVHNRLIKRVRARGAPDFRTYLDIVEAEPAEAEHFVNALTTNLTWFFREPHHFEILAEKAGSLVNRVEPVRVWCAACSTGEEAYSIAFTLAEVLGPGRFEVVASDIDTAALARANAGVYGIERLRNMPQARVARFFLKGTGPNEGFVRIRPELARQVTFMQVNLLSSYPLKTTFDAIFCRNVLIYFDRPSQLDALERMRLLLKPDGLLFTGSSESLFYASNSFRAVARTVYGPRTLS